MRTISAIWSSWGPSPQLRTFLQPLHFTIVKMKGFGQRGNGAGKAQSYNKRSPKEYFLVLINPQELNLTAMGYKRRSWKSDQTWLTMMKPEKFPPGSTRQSQRCQIPPEKEELCGAGVKVALTDWKQNPRHVGPARSSGQGRRTTKSEAAPIFSPNHGTAWYRNQTVHNLN